MALDKYDDDVDTVPSGGRAGVGSLMNGKGYKLCVESAELKETSGGHDIFKMKVLVLEGPSKTGLEFDIDTFLTKKAKDESGNERIVMNDVKIGILKKDLETLGFDTPEWSKANGRPFSKELPKAVLCLPGVQFIADKSQKDDFHNLKIVSRAAGDNKPEKFGPAELDAAVNAEANTAPFSV